MDLLENALHLSFNDPNRDKLMASVEYIRLICGASEVALQGANRFNYKNNAELPGLPAVVKSLASQYPENTLGKLWNSFTADPDIVLAGIMAQREASVKTGIGFDPQIATVPPDPNLKSLCYAMVECLVECVLSPLPSFPPIDLDV